MRWAKEMTQKFVGEKQNSPRHTHLAAENLPQLLLGAQLVRVTALALAAVVRLERQTRIAATADHLVAVVLARKNNQRRLEATTTKAQHQVKGALLLDVVVRKRVAVLQLLAGKDQTLLVRGDALLVLDLRLHVVDAVPRLDLQRDGLASQSLHENLHVGTNKTKKHKQKNTKMKNKKKGCFDKKKLKEKNQKRAFQFGFAETPN